MGGAKLYVQAMISRMLILLIGLSGVAFGAKVTRGPYLQLAHEGGITIVWRTDKAIEHPRVMYQEDGSKEALMCSGESILHRGVRGEARLHTVPRGSEQYEARLVGLKPLTTYR